MDIGQMAFMEQEINPTQFLILLSKIAIRVESGNSNSISLKECTDWGLNSKDAITGMLLLVRSGVLTQKVAIYEEDEDFFYDVNRPEEITGRSIEDLRFWFKPKLNAEEFKPFFA